MTQTDDTPQLRACRPNSAGPQILETLEMRRARVLADDRLITMKMVAQIIGRSYQRVRELNMYAREARELLADPDTDPQTRADVEQYLPTALPPPEPDPDRPHNRPVFRASTIYEWARHSVPPRLDEWYEPQGTDQPGRPPGASRRLDAVILRHRRSLADQLQRLARIHVSDTQRQRLAPLLEASVAMHRARNLRMPLARSKNGTAYCPNGC